MRKIIILFAALLISFVSITAQENWKTFNSETGKFSIDFFANVTVSQVNKEKVTTYKTKFTNDNMVIMVNSSKHKAALDDRKDLLKKSLDTFVSSVGGIITASKEIENNGAIGTYATMNLQNGIFLEYKVYLKDFYQYQVIIYSKDNNYNQEMANRYFETFKIED